jgi:galacturan 1,4-alpha-galacturonidase
VNSAGAIHRCPFKMAAFPIVQLLLASQLALKPVASVTLPFPIPRSPSNSGKVCTLTPFGCRKDDTPQILEGFRGLQQWRDGRVPGGQEVLLANRMDPVVSDVTIEWRGHHFPIVTGTDSTSG